MNAPTNALMDPVAPVAPVPTSIVCTARLTALTDVAPIVCAAIVPLAPVAPVLNDAALIDPVAMIEPVAPAVPAPTTAFLSTPTDVKLELTTAVPNVVELSTATLLI